MPWATTCPAPLICRMRNPLRQSRDECCQVELEFLELLLKATYCQLVHQISLNPLLVSHAATFNQGQICGCPPQCAKPFSPPFLWFVHL
jgi:hypothetical protein